MKTTSTPWVQPACDPASDLLIWRTRRDYPVRGTTLDELLASMEPQRPRDPAGMAWDALTTWEIRWTYPYVERMGSCSIGREQVAVDIRMRLPSWEPPVDAVPALVTKWGRYVNALEAHEENHALVALAAACEIRQVLRSLGAKPDCRVLEQSADRATQAVMDRYLELEERYDQETLHGATEGAVLR